MLIAPFKVKIGREGIKLCLMAAAHHVPVRGAGIEPHVKNVVDLVVLRRFIGGHVVFGLRACPGFDPFDFDFLGDFFENFDRARMQFPRRLIHEERQGHAPVALTGNAPVGAVFDHGVQTVVAPGGEELRRIHAFKRRFPEALFGHRGIQNALGVGVGLIHTHEPLARRTVDQGGLMTPAVHVAVGHFAAGEKRPRHAKRVENLGLRLPDEHPGKQGEPVGVDAVALHGVQNFVVRHPVLLAGDEVVHAVGRRRMHDARARRRFDVVGEIHRRQTLVARIDFRQRMPETDVFKGFALRGRDNLAFAVVAL